MIIKPTIEDEKVKYDGHVSGLFLSHTFERPLKIENEHSPTESASLFHNLVHLYDNTLWTNGASI